MRLRISSHSKDVTLEQRGNWRIGNSDSPPKSRATAEHQTRHSATRQPYATACELDFVNLETVKPERRTAETGENNKRYCEPRVPMPVPRLFLPFPMSAQALTR